jgi:hypothetical protein
VLLGQGYGTTPEAVIGEYGVEVTLWLSNEKRRTQAETQLSLFYSQ